MKELRFRTPGLRFYAQGLALSVLGLGLIACGTVVMGTLGNWADTIYFVSSVFVAVTGVAFTLFVWFIFVWGTLTTWRQWRQLRPPGAVIDDSGVRYLAVRRPVFVPWPDIEKLNVQRIIFRNRVVTKVSLRLAPHAGLLRGGPITVPATRSLNVGLASDADVPENVVVVFLAGTAPSLMTITEEDRRPTADGSSRR